MTVIYFIKLHVVNLPQDIYIDLVAGKPVFSGFETKLGLN